MGRGPVETALRIMERLGLGLPPNVERAGALGDSAALARALRYVGNDYTRGDAAMALAEEGGSGTEILLAALTESDPRVRATAAEGLARVVWQDTDDTVRARAGVRLIAALRNTDADTRAAAARALGGVGGRGAVLALRTASTDPVEDVRLGAASALGRLLPNKIRQWQYEPPDPGWTPPRPEPVAETTPTPSTVAETAPGPAPGPAPSPRPATLPPLRPPRLRMIECPRCLKLSNPQSVRCHRCGARLRVGPGAIS